MDDRTRRMIEAYIPNPRDPELGFDEFYCRNSADKVCKVYVSSIFPYKEYIIYGLRYAESKKHFTGDYGTAPFDGMMRGKLYDNKQDCRDMTHDVIDDWERLRQIQMEENA